jgi:hypothetical protein
MVMDIICRRQHPKIELEFAIERKFIKGQPRQANIFPSHTYLTGSPPPEKDTNIYTLIVRARNTGKVFAQYVNSFIYVPIQLLSTNTVKGWGANRKVKIDDRDYLEYYEENTQRDVIGSKGFEIQYGPSRFDPVLPGLSHKWEIALKRDLDHFERDDLVIKWTTYADNAAPSDGETRVKDIKAADAFEPDFKTYYEEDE